ncbi:hypothetical protein ANN_08168 [Periplaneta americana]|uniref:Uncharacterized protein n=1 Tax=Periplaneta americana TaxID=6978 RepID=A0ABQ8T0N2_PERAM|nr:hypothetical protein ANN_08168 [Periplaneta americana]
MKWIVIEKSVGKGKPKVHMECHKYYRTDVGDGDKPTLLKRRKILKSTMQELPIVSSSFREKKQDIRKLLEKFGGEN